MFLSQRLVLQQVIYDSFPLILLSCKVSNMFFLEQLCASGDVGAKSKRGRLLAKARVVQQDGKRL